MISVIRSGMNASLKQLDVLSHNIANAKTTGFKRSQATFEDIYADKVSFGAPGKIGHGSLNNDVRTMRSQGALEETGQVLDLAIEGEVIRNGLFFFDFGFLMGQFILNCCLGFNEFQIFT